LYFDVIFLGFGSISALVARGLIQEGKKIAIITRMKNSILPKQISFIDKASLFDWDEVIFKEFKSEKAFVVWRDCDFTSSSKKRDIQMNNWLFSDQFQTRELIHLSSASVYKASRAIRSETSPIQDNSPKRKVENVLRELMKTKECAVTNLRISNIYGDSIKSGFIFNCLEALEKRKNLEVFENLDIERDYLYVDDLVQAILNLPDEYCLERVVNISTGIGTRVSKILELILEFSGYKPLIQFVQAPEKIQETCILSCEKLKGLIAWNPKTIDEGLHLLVPGKK